MIKSHYLAELTINSNIQILKVQLKARINEWWFWVKERQMENGKSKKVKAFYEPE